VQAGSFDELHTQEGYFSDMLKSQFVLEPRSA
jgi:hypothetical protein